MESGAVSAPLPRVTIQFCTQCKWMLRAAYVSDQSLSCVTTGDRMRRLCVARDLEVVKHFILVQFDTAFTTFQSSFSIWATIIKSVQFCSLLFISQDST